LAAPVSNDCQETLDWMVETQYRQATSYELDRIARQFLGMHRGFGGAESDRSFRRRIEDALGIDSDAALARKLEPEIEKWDEEEREAKL
jgi:hypothetical protein